MSTVKAWILGVVTAGVAIMFAWWYRLTQQRWLETQARADALERWHKEGLARDLRVLETAVGEDYKRAHTTRARVLSRHAKLDAGFRAAGVSPREITRRFHRLGLTDSH